MYYALISFVYTAVRYQVGNLSCELKPILFVIDQRVLVSVGHVRTPLHTRVIPERREIPRNRINYMSRITGRIWLHPRGGAWAEVGVPGGGGLGPLSKLNSNLGYMAQVTAGMSNYLYNDASTVGLSSAS